MGNKAPEPPDPYKVADAQTKSNIDTAKAQQQIAMTGQTNPYGSVQYVLDPTSPSGYRAVTQFSPEMQALQNQAQGNAANFGSTVGQQLGRVNDRLGQDYTLDAGRGAVLSDIQRTMMDPMWSSKQDALQNQLANQGIMPGSQAYQLAMRQFSQQSDDAYNKMFLDSYNTANSAALQNHLLPLTEMGMLTSAGAASPMPALPQFGQTSSPGVAPTDLTSGVNNAYNQQVSQSNAAMGGLYGLGAAGLGGWASTGFKGGAALLGLLSDRRLKTDIVKVGNDPRGWGIYEYRYVWSEHRHTGFMADEVEPIRPDAVITHDNGIKAVRYDLLEIANG